MAVVWPVGRVLAAIQTTVYFTKNTLLQFAQKSLFFPRQGHQKHKPRSRKQRETHEHLYIYIYMFVDPPDPPKPQEIKTPNTWYTRENTFTPRTHTHPKNQGIHTRKEHWNDLKPFPRNWLRSGTHPPNTRVRKNNA